MVHPQFLNPAARRAAPILVFEILLTSTPLRGDVQRRLQSALYRTPPFAASTEKHHLLCCLTCRQMANLQLGTKRGTAESLKQLCLADQVRCAGHHLRCLPSYLSFARISLLYIGAVRYAYCICIMPGRAAPTYVSCQPAHARMLHDIGCYSIRCLDEQTALRSLTPAPYL